MDREDQLLKVVMVSKGLSLSLDVGTSKVYRIYGDSMG
jgi:hypothetical protein